MTENIRQQIITLAKELPDESLPEALDFLLSLAKNTESDRTLDKKPDSDQKPGFYDNSGFDPEIKSRNPVSNPSYADYDQAMAAYRVGSEKYKNALRKLAE